MFNVQCSTKKTSNYLAFKEKKSNLHTLNYTGPCRLHLSAAYMGRSYLREIPQNHKGKSFLV